MYRLYIDFPMPELSRENSVQKTDKILEIIKAALKDKYQGETFSFRLGHDDDRKSNRNHYRLDSNSHCVTGKIEVFV